MVQQGLQTAKREVCFLVHDFVVFLGILYSSLAVLPKTRFLYDCIMIKKIALMMIKTNCLLPTYLTTFF